MNRLVNSGALVKSLAFATIAGTLIGLGAGCGSMVSKTGDPIAALRNPGISGMEREAAVARAWELGESDPTQKPAVRKALKDVVWAQNMGEMLRSAALNQLLQDTDPASIEDTREMLRLILPREPSRSIVAIAAREAEKRGWREFAPALVRSWSRPNEAVKDIDRAERTALARLFPDKNVEDVVYDVFLNPPEQSGTSTFDWSDRVRADAWDLLARIDADGVRRADLINGSQSVTASASSRKVVEDLRASVRDLKVVPLTGAELRWLASLRDSSKPGNAAWWNDATNAVRQLDASRTDRMALRHVEAVRFATRYKPEYVRATRAELLSMLEDRLKKREHWRRTKDTTEFKLPLKEYIDAWREQLRWGDLLAMLLVDDALRTPAMTEALFLQTELDRRDDTTEYGGVLSYAADGAPVVTLYPPRPSQRTGDMSFVASDEMIRRSDTALAHYHFHVQRERNEGYAGPSGGDMKYAASLGRNCLVITSVRSDTLAFDFYQPDGVVIDLGSIERPAKK
jgi:hypothetical protein